MSARLYRALAAAACCLIVHWAGPGEALAASKDRSRTMNGDTNQLGPSVSSTKSSRRQYSSLGAPFESATLRTSRFSFTPGFLAAAVSGSGVAPPISEMDLSVVTAKTEPFGVAITPQTWQNDVDPAFLWEPPHSGAQVAGYSYALNADPDDTIETSSTTWSVAADPMKRLPDGKQNFSVKAVNSAGNSGKPASVEVWIDSTPPTINSYTPSPGVLLNTLTPSITASIIDAHSGITAQSVRFLINGNAASVSVDQATGLVTAVRAGLREGANSLEIRASDAIGNSAAPVVWSVTADVTPPRGSVRINAGASSSTSMYVTLNLDATDAIAGVTRMMISNDQTTGYVEEPYAPVRELWRLNAVRGPQRVYVKFIDAVGNVSAPVTDDIELLLLSPETLIVSGPAGVTAQQKAKFIFKCPEDGCVFSYAFDNEDWSDWSTETTVVREGLVFGNHYFKVKAAKEANGQQGIQADEEDPTPAQRTWVVGAEVPEIFVPRGGPIKLWQLE